MTNCEGVEVLAKSKIFFHKPPYSYLHQKNGIYCWFLAMFYLLSPIQVLFWVNNPSVQIDFDMTETLYWLAHSSVLGGLIQGSTVSVPLLTTAQFGVAMYREMPLS